MPRTGSTVTIPTDDMTSNGASPRLNDEELDDLFAGLPQAQQEIKLDRIANDSPGSVPGNMLEAPTGMVVLRNIKYPNESYCIPYVDDRGDLVFGQDTVLQFYAGDLVCGVEQADFIQGLAPWVYREPLPPFTTEPLIHPATQFTTRVTAAYNEHVSRWAENQ